MSVSSLHVLAQGPVLAALGRAALSGLRRGGTAGAAVTPGPWVEATLPPRPAGLIDAYVRNVGGDPGAYRGTVPPHLFPQWSFPLAARALSGLPYPMVRVLNAGCSFEARAPLPAGEPLRVQARLASVDDDGRRALITHEIITGTASSPGALRCELRAYVPLSPRERAPGRRPCVDPGAREIAFLKIPADAGLDFAKLTGDFNPIHWLGPYARAAGFRAPILHGFGTFARACEALNRAVLAGAPWRMRRVEARFTRPLPLPARVGVYVGEGGVFWVGDAPGGGVFLEGTWEHRDE